MIIYEKVKKNNKIAVFNNSNDILDIVTNKLQKEDYNYEVYNEIDKLSNKVVKGKMKIVIMLKLNYEYIEKISKDSSVNIIVLKAENESIDYKKLKKLNIQNIKDIDFLEKEIDFALRIVAQQGKIDYQKFKLDIVSNLVESIAHKIQANLLTIGASQDVIKMVSEDSKTSENKEKSKIIEDLYLKNDTALQRSNSLLQFMSDATNISSETIMTYDDILDITKIILDEYIKENNVSLDFEVKLKENAYICGPLNDLIFIMCKIIKEMILYNEKNIIIKTHEDEEKWFFDIECSENIENREVMYDIQRYLTYVENAGGKVKNNMFTIYVKKVKE